MTISTELRKHVLSSVIELYEIDLNPIGVGEVFYLTPTPDRDGEAIIYDGKEYIAFPIRGEGFETGMDGAPPQPTLAVSNVTRYIQSYLSLYQDLVGARVTRLLTFENQLETPGEVFGQQNFLVYQLVSQTKVEIRWRLASVLDSKQIKLPREQVLRTEFPGAGLFRGR